MHLTQLTLCVIIAAASTCESVSAQNLVAWGAAGSSNYGQAAVPGDLGTCLDFEAGGFHSIAVTSTGLVRCWGSDANQQCSVPAGLAGVSAVGAGFKHSIALHADGGVTCWGGVGQSAEFGQGVVPAGLPSIRQIAAGGFHNICLGNNGILYCWGAGTTGATGSPHFGQSAIPVNLGGAVRSVAAGLYHSMALRTDGIVRCWGAGSNGTTTSPHYGQSTVPTGLASVAKISAAGYSSMALLGDGGVRCWGTTLYGQTNVPTDLGRCVDIDAGRYFHVALRSDGSVRFWGLDTSGGTALPLNIGPYARISAGESHCVASIASFAPVKWEPSQGGNGHWYSVVTDNDGLTWDTARLRAELLGGELVSLETGSEKTFVLKNFGLRAAPRAYTFAISPYYYGPWIGGYQEPGAGEPVGGWRWLSGPLFDPVDVLCCNDACGGLNEDKLHLHAELGAAEGWNDLPGGEGCWSSLPKSFVIEWSADCNNDGIVDYEQVYNGALADFDGDNIPDCCERAEPCVPGEHVGQWEIARGGNGHWYSLVVEPFGMSWEEARAAAINLAGDLAALESASEQSFVFDTFGYGHAGGVYPSAVPFSVFRMGPWIGGFQDPAGIEPSGGWRWVTGELFDPTAAYCCNDACSGADEDKLHLVANYEGLQSWNDLPSTAPCVVQPRSYLIEWSRDCNTDGVVDFGQIRDGSVPDVDGNNIPDSCDCLADVFPDGIVNGADLGIVLNQWGQGKGAVSDINRDGIVDGADLSALLNSWGSCP